MERKLLRTSVELTAKAILANSLDVFPKGTKVFLPWLPGKSFHENFPCIEAILKNGLTPVPHIVARNVRSLSELGLLMRTLTVDFGVSQVLVIAGGASSSIGPFSNTLQLLHSDHFRCEFGQDFDKFQNLVQIHIAAHPSGHPHINEVSLNKGLAEKCGTVHAHCKSRCSAITQISFSQMDIRNFLKKATSVDFLAEVRVGILPKLSLARLAKLITELDIIAASEAIVSNGLSPATLLKGNDALQFTDSVLLHCMQNHSPSVGLHIYGLGSFATTVETYTRIEGCLEQHRQP